MMELHSMAGTLPSRSSEIRGRGLGGDLIVPVATASLLVVFSLAVVRTSDPARATGVLHPKDERLRHIGSLSFAEGSKLVVELRQRRDAESNPERRAMLSTQLSDALVERGQHGPALTELDQALRRFPEQPALQVRAAMLYFALGQRERAADALATARRLGGEAELVGRAAALIEGGSARAP
jgi:hypothetical protein